MIQLMSSIREHLNADVRIVSDQLRKHSRVIRILAETNGSSERLFVKQVRLEDRGPGEREMLERRVKNEYDILLKIHESMEPDPRLMRIRPVACFPQHLALVMEEAPGHTVSAEIRRLGRLWPSRRSLRDLEECLRRAGLWMARFQQLTMSAEAPAIPLRRMSRQVDEFLDAITSRPRVNFPMDLAKRIRTFLDRTLEQAGHEELQTTGSTGEISPENMLVDGGRVTIVDFGMYTTGTIFGDPSMMYQHLSTLHYKPLYRPHVIRLLQRSFLEGFGRPELDLHPLFTAYRIKHKLSRINAESGRKWSAMDPARKLFYRRAWRLERKALAELVA